VHYSFKAFIELMRRSASCATKFGRRTARATRLIVVANHPTLIDVCF